MHSEVVWTCGSHRLLASHEFWLGSRLRVRDIKGHLVLSVRVTLIQEGAILLAPTLLHCILVLLMLRSFPLNTRVFHYHIQIRIWDCRSFILAQFHLWDFGWFGEWEYMPRFWGTFLNSEASGRSVLSSGEVTIEGFVHSVELGSLLTGRSVEVEVLGLAFLA